MTPGFSDWSVTEIVGILISLLLATSIRACCDALRMAAAGYHAIALRSARGNQVCVCARRPVLEVSTYPSGRRVSISYHISHKLLWMLP